MSFEVKVAAGAMDEAAKASLMHSLTSAVANHAVRGKADFAPVYVIIRDVDGKEWGVFGRPGSIDLLRNPPVEAKAF